MITTSMIYKNTKRINDDNNALDIAMECADFLEQTGAFAFKNWEDGEFVSGPFIANFYVEFSLMYPKKRTPDPDYIERLTALDCIVEMKEDEYKRLYYERNQEIKFGDQMFEKKVSIHKVWIITIKVPQRFLVLDGNTLFNVDGKDVYYDDLEAVYDEDSAEVTEDTGDISGDGGLDFGDDDDEDFEL